jgi:hypothetical protein
MGTGEIPDAVNGRDAGALQGIESIRGAVRERRIECSESGAKKSKALDPILIALNAMTIRHLYSSENKTRGCSTSAVPRKT